MSKFHSLKFGLIVGLSAFVIGGICEALIRLFVSRTIDFSPIFPGLISGLIAIPLGIVRQIFGMRLYTLSEHGYLEWYGWINVAILWFLVGFVINWIYRKIRYRNGQ